MKIVDRCTVDYIDHCGSDLSTVNAARVSFAKWKEELEEGDIKLINFLAKHEHTSPFNHAFLSFRVQMPMFVARQLVKHKFLPWNEVSRRYVDDEPEFYLPSKWRKKAEDKKQGSLNQSVKLDWDGEDFEYPDSSDPYYPEDLCKQSLKTYKSLLASGVCPEQARMVLPINTMTTVIWSGTLGAWLNMLRLRLKEDTQQETREVAQEIAYYVSEYFPNCFEAVVGTTPELAALFVTRSSEELGLYD